MHTLEIKTFDESSTLLTAHFSQDALMDEDVIMLIDVNSNEFNFGDISTESLAFRQGSALTRIDIAGRGVSMTIHGFGSGAQVLTAFMSGVQNTLSTEGRVLHKIIITDEEGIKTIGGFMANASIGPWAADRSREITLSYESLDSNFITTETP